MLLRDGGGPISSRHTGDGASADPGHRAGSGQILGIDLCSVRAVYHCDAWRRAALRRGDPAAQIFPGSVWTAGPRPCGRAGCRRFGQVGPSGAGVRCAREMPVRCPQVPDRTEPLAVRQYQRAWTPGLCVFASGTRSVGGRSGPGWNLGVVVRRTSASIAGACPVRRHPKARG